MRASKQEKKQASEQACRQACKQAKHASKQACKHAKPSQAKPSQAKPNPAPKLAQASPSQARQGKARQGHHTQTTATYLRQTYSSSGLPSQAPLSLSVIIDMIRYSSPVAVIHLRIFVIFLCILICVVEALCPARAPRPYDVRPHDRATPTAAGHLAARGRPSIATALSCQNHSNLSQHASSARRPGAQARFCHASACAR